MSELVWQLLGFGFRKLETAHRLPELNLPGEQQQHRLRRLKPSQSPVKKTE